MEITDIKLIDKSIPTPWKGGDSLMFKFEPKYGIKGVTVKWITGRHTHGVWMEFWVPMTTIAWIQYGYKTSKK